MTYIFPPSLHPLRDYLRDLGADTNAFVSARQAAYMAQQLLGTRVKFPDKGADMTSTLFLIQKGVTEGKALKSTTDQVIRNGKKPKATQKGKIPANQNKHHRDFSPAVFATGVHIFCDGAAIPNPGVGGWGVVVYRDGVEVDTAHGEEAETTNNRMEMIGLLHAIKKAGQLRADWREVTIWCDSQYCVKGANDWRHKWKKQGWNRKGANSPKRSEETAVKNVDLWIAIDEALSAFPSGTVKISWVKGHHGIVGNERADELAEQGREGVVSANETPADDLDFQYRAIMAG